MSPVHSIGSATTARRSGRWSTTHPYTDALKGDLGKFTELTGITVQYDEFPESNYFEKLTVDLQSGQPTYDVFMLGAYFVWQYGPPGYLEDFLPWIENESATNPDYDWEDIYPNLRSSDQWSLAGRRSARHRGPVRPAVGV